MTAASPHPAIQYFENGFELVRVACRTKQPIDTDWPTKRFTAEDLLHCFNGRPQNIGVKVGDAYGTADADCDCMEAVRAARFFMPDTRMIFGRASKPASHWFYRMDPPHRSLTYKDTDGKMILELRCQAKDGSVGMQTVVPPSIHESGEEIRFELGCGPMPANIDADVLLPAMARTAAAALLARHWPARGSGRHATMLALAGGLARAGWSEEEAKLFCRAIYHSLADPDRTAMNRSDTEVQSTYKRKTNGEDFTGWPHVVETVGEQAVKLATDWLGIERPRQGSRLRFFPYTDTGNAERLVARYGADLRYCHPQKSWYTWDERRWVADRRGHVMDLAKNIARALYAEAAEIEKQTDREACAEFARKCESTERKKAALVSAQSEAGVPVLPEEFDADSFLLNCLNGTVDLRTGELHPHRRDNLITRLSPTKYDAAARSELWERFLDEATGGDPEMQDFLQRAVGYSLTGDVSEEVLFFVHGPGGTGKSTFLEAIRTVLGDYAKSADFESFIQRRDAGGVRNDIAELAGRRFVVSIEVDEGKKLAEGLVKLLTGGDTVRARFLYQEAFDFLPQFKLWLAANHAPKVKHNDSAMWRRILRIPFEQGRPKDKRDPSVKARLKDLRESGPAILAWAIEGCLRWRESGLNVPEVVVDATEEYRSDMDPLRDFVAECCVLHPQAWVSAAQVRQVYEQFCRENGEKRPLGPRDFADGLKARGCTRERRHAGHGWLGIGLVSGDSVTS
jgi:putative DNA primase/helicase